MRERVELSGGSFSIESHKRAGTVIRASWPIEQSSLSLSMGDHPKFP